MTGKLKAFRQCGIVKQRKNTATKLVTINAKIPRNAWLSLLSTGHKVTKTL